MPKITISVPNSSWEKIDKLKDYFETTSASAVFSLGLEVLNWVMIQDQSESSVISIKTEDSEKEPKIIIQEVPLSRVSIRKHNYINIRIGKSQNP